jgi:general secretion pathway protein C
MSITLQAQSYLNGWMAGKTLPKWLENLVTSNQLPWLVSILLVLLIGWQMANFTWGLIPVPDSPYQTASTSLVNQKRPQQSDMSASAELAQVASLKLFGSAAKKEVTKKIDTRAPDTPLNLTLYGVFVAEKPEEGAAIIGASGSEQKYHKVGSAIMSDVTLQAVFSDRVVILRGGKSEVLRFPKSKDMETTTTQRRASRTVSRSTSTFDMIPIGQSGSSSGANLSRYREMLRDEPLKIFEHVRFVPVRAREGTKGYRILPQKNRELYNKLGVRPSDLVTAVNGIQLTDDREAMKLIDKLKDAQSLEVEIIRNGQPRSFTFDLN